MYNHYVHKKGYNMTIQTTSMASARANFAESLDAASNGEVILIQRQANPIRQLLMLIYLKIFFLLLILELLIKLS